MKRMISLLLAILMVLALTACGDSGNQDPNEGQSQAVGQALYEKYAEIISMLEEKDYQGAIRDITQMAIAEQRGEVEEVPVMQVLCESTWYTIYEDAPQEITFSEDGTCKIGGETMNWLAEESWSDTYLRLQLSKDGQICRFVSIETGNKVPYVNLSYAEEYDNGISSGESIGTYYNHPLMPYLLRSWYELSDYETVGDVSGFSLGSGSANVNGDSCDWTLLSSDSSDSLVAHIDGKNERDGSYTATLTMRDGHPVMTFVDDTTGDSGLYYNGNSDGYEKTWIEYVYAEAMENYSDYLEHGSFWCDVTETNYRDSDDNALSYLYDQFASLAEYKDAAQILESWDSVRFNRVMRMLNTYLRGSGFNVGETYYSKSNGNVLPYLYSQFAELAGYAEADAILDRFTVVEDVFLKSVCETTDNMGNVNSGTDESCEYNELGQMTRYNNSTQFSRWYGSSNNAYYSYDESGRVSGINLGYTDTVYARITPTYDSNGNKISEHVVKNDAEFDIIYTYDDQNRLIGARRPNTNYNDPECYYYTWTYTYDNAGNLLQEVYAFMDNGTLRSESINAYTYDAAGVRIGETDTYNFYSYSHGQLYETHTHVADYVFDNQGRVIQKNWTYGNTVYTDGREEKPSNASSVYTYTYGNVYFFDSTGMEIGE